MSEKNVKLLRAEEKAAEPAEPAVVNWEILYQDGTALACADISAEGYSVDPAGNLHLGSPTALIASFAAGCWSKIIIKADE
jgi:hypothetical protein